MKLKSILILSFALLTACSKEVIIPEPICTNPSLTKPKLEEIENDRSHLRNYTKLFGAIYTRDGVIDRCTAPLTQ